MEETMIIYASCIEKKDNYYRNCHFFLRRYDEKSKDNKSCSCSNYNCDIFLAFSFLSFHI